MEKINELYYQYSKQIIAWYNSLEELYQYGVLSVLMLISFFIIGFFILTRTTK
ncbi:MAG: hypothetical protein A4E71_01062 [Smithella sp. PtaU1.Bin162]|nr:MAG: hypothetical protein A4E71_01062 [Smithella sp. PtaU1.Bin162]